VEDHATALHLQSVGVDFVQGYHIGKPVPLTHINLIRFCDSQYSEKAVA
jgi:EAL domain-containing protein (putative c-di-GMP-specific phosphodiesterase class I)